MRRRARGLVAAVAAVAVIAVAGCGDDDFENDPRPAVTAEVGIELGEKAVSVSPAEFGAGLVTFTIANLGDTEAAIEIFGPVTATSDTIPPGGTTALKTDLTTGEYEARAEGAEAEPFVFQVGPERESSGEELLLP